MLELTAILASYNPQQIFVLADACVQLPSPITSFPVLALSLTAESKCLATVEKVWTFLDDHHATRSSLLINVGGGTISDIGGFAAATYLRGIDYINIPTTILAMVDAAWGGKTGINYDGLKNRIGAFHLPQAVILLPELLHTLPDQQWLSGCGEVIKTALLDGSWTKGAVPSIQNLLERQNMESVPKLVRACAQFKKDIVAQDYQETGLRKILNFGHTIGHALEEQSHGKMEHGYAVVYGMIAELYLSIVLLGCPREPLTQLTHWMITYYGRPQCNCQEVEALIEMMGADKKNKSTTQINCTLLRQPGEPVYDQVIARPLLREALDYLFSL